MRLLEKVRGMGGSYLLPAAIFVVAVLVLVLWVWPTYKQLNLLKIEIASARSELSKVKKARRDLRMLKRYADEHGNDPVEYVRRRCFVVGSEEEITPFLLDNLAGLKNGFYLFSWSPSQGKPKKVGQLSPGEEIFKVPISFGFDAYVVEAMGFISSLSRKKGLWVDTVEAKRKKEGFPSYRVSGGACFLVESEQ